jgi:hypothetical protein
MLSFFTYIRNDEADERNDRKSVRYSQYRQPLAISYKNINYKTNNTSIFKTNLPSLTSATLLHSFRSFWTFLALRKVLKFTKSCKNTTWKKCLLFRCRECSRYNANFKFDQSVFTIHDSPLHILRSVRMITHERWAMRPRYLMNFRLR